MHRSVWLADQKRIFSMKRVMCGALLLDLRTRTTISREKRTGRETLRT